MSCAEKTTWEQLQKYALGCLAYLFLDVSALFQLGTEQAVSSDHTEIISVQLNIKNITWTRSKDICIQSITGSASQ